MCLCVNTYVHTVGLLTSPSASINLAGSTGQITGGFKEVRMTASIQVYMYVHICTCTHIFVSFCDKKILLFLFIPFFLLDDIHFLFIYFYILGHVDIYECIFIYIFVCIYNYIYIYI
jgi:hypothetical protein